MKVDFKNFQGKVHKSATIYSNDPKNPRTTVSVAGKIKALVNLNPGNTVVFRGLADQIKQSFIELSSTSQPFHITKIESDVDRQIKYQLETVEEGKRYKLNIKNQATEGKYRGFIKVHTDMPKKPEISIRVIGSVEGEIVVRPPTVLIGKLGDNQPVRSGKVLVVNNFNKPFKITKMIYDDQLLKVSQQPLPEGSAFGYSVEITPQLENAPKGVNQRQELDLIIQTDTKENDQHTVKVYLVNAVKAQ